MTTEPITFPLKRFLEFGLRKMHNQFFQDPELSSYVFEVNIEEGYVKEYPDDLNDGPKKVYFKDKLIPKLISLKREFSDSLDTKMESILDNESRITFINSLIQQFTYFKNMPGNPYGPHSEIINQTLDALIQLVELKYVPSKMLGKAEVSEKLGEFTIKRQGLAMNYILECIPNFSSDRSMIAKFLIFMTSKDVGYSNPNHSNIYKAITGRANDNIADYQYIKTYFVDMKLMDVVTKIDIKIAELSKK